MKPFVLVRQHFGATVFDARAHEYRDFGHAHALALFALAGHSTDARAAEIFEELTEELGARGWLALDGSFPARVIDREARTPRDHLVGPLLVHVEVNAICNLACAHCFAAPLPRPGQLTLAELDDVFAQMAALGAMRVSLTGGEPLLRADLIDVVDSALARGLSVSLTTNGLLIDAPFARAIARRRLQWLNVSLDGATPATNDVVRGAGTFARVRARLALLRDAGAPFSLAFTLMKTNLHEVEACVALAEREGATTAVFRPLYPVGAALQRPDLWPSRDEVRDAFARLGAVASTCGTAIEHGGDADGCGAGSTILSLDVEGRASPCGFLGGSFLGPSIRERSLEELWASRHFAELRDGARDAAGGYAGGCRARALAHNGSAFGADPWTGGATTARARGRGLPIVSAP